MLVIVMDDQGGGMYMHDSTATFVDLSMNDNSASEAPDIYNSGTTISCSTSCTAGQYSEQCGNAMSNDGNLQCLINCEVSSTS